VSPEWVTAIVAALLGTGGLGAWLTYRIARRKVPVEVDSIAVQGAESAVLTMKNVNDALERRAESAEARERRKDEIIAEQATTIEELKDQLRAARTQIDEVLKRLEAFETTDGL